MHSIYCPKCHTLLLKAEVVKAEIKCHKCKNLINITFVTQEAFDKVLTRASKSSTIVE